MHPFDIAEAILCALTAAFAVDAVIKFARLCRLAWELQS